MNALSLLVCSAMLVGGVDKAPEVGVAQPLSQQVIDWTNCTGRIEPAACVEIRGRVTGYLVQVFVKEGQIVRAGEVLFQIDPRAMETELRQAEEALKQSDTQIRLVEADHKRAENLFRQKAISMEELDKLAGSLTQAQTQRRLALAHVERVRLDLDNTRIRTPINGHIGRCLLGPGNLIKADDTHLATIIATDRVFVYFDIDELTVLRLRRAMRESKTGTKNWAESPVLMGLLDEEGFPRQGKIEFVDHRLDPKTGGLRVGAIFPNPDGFLMPGLQARIRLQTSEPYSALLVPEQAVVRKALVKGMSYLFVVNENNKVEQRLVELGQEMDGMRVVKKGLQAEARVVLRPQGLEAGMTVDPRLEAVSEKHQK